MGRFRKMRRIFIALLLALCAVPLLVLTAGQIGQHLLRHRAELLLAEIQSLKLRKTPWPQAQQQFQHWGISRQFDKHCNDHTCSLEVTLNDFAAAFLSRTNIFIRLDDYFRWRFKLSYNMGPFARLEQALFRAYVGLGGHPAMIRAGVGMRDGIVWSKGFSVLIETYTHDDPVVLGGWKGEYALIADASSVPRLGHYSSYSADPQLMLHPYYEIDRPSSCTICIAGWAHFTPYADPVDVSRLMQFDLSCLTRWHPCLAQGDIMPAAWKQYRVETAHSNESASQPGCSPSVLEILGRDNDNIATSQVLRYRETVDDHGYRSGIATVRVLDRLKGATGWKSGETRKVSIWFGTDGGNARIRAGSRLVMFFRNKFPIEYGNNDSIENLTSPGYGCPVVTATEPNLKFVRRGIAQDYRALDKDE